MYFVLCGKGLLNLERVCAFELKGHLIEIVFDNSSIELNCESEDQALIEMKNLTDRLVHQKHLYTKSENKPDQPKQTPVIMSAGEAARLPDIAGKKIAFSAFSDFGVVLTAQYYEYMSDVVFKFENDIHVYINKSNTVEVLN